MVELRGNGIRDGYHLGARQINMHMHVDLRSKFAVCGCCSCCQRAKALTRPSTWCSHIYITHCVCAYCCFDFQLLSAVSLESALELPLFAAVPCRAQQCEKQQPQLTIAM